MDNARRIAILSDFVNEFICFLTKSIIKRIVRASQYKEDNMADETYEEIVRVTTCVTKAMVDKPDRVQVKMIPGDSTIIIELTVDPDDIGAVIGRKGIHVTAMRTLLFAIGGKYRRRVQLDIVEPPREALVSSRR